MDETEAGRERTALTGPAAHHRRVVVGVDGSDGSVRALYWALMTAARRGAVLQVVSAYPVDFYWRDPFVLDRSRIDSLRADTESRSRELLETARRVPAVAAVPGTAAVPVEVSVAPGEPAEVLLQIAEEADALVVGSRGRGGVRSTLLGSVALQCSTHASCPVVVVHATAVQAWATPRIVVGLDGSEAARAALQHAVRAAVELDGAAEAVAAYSMPDYWSEMYVVIEQSMDDLREAALTTAHRLVSEVLGEEPAVPVSVVAEAGGAADVLVQHAVGAALLVVGSRSRSRSRLTGMVLGSVALHSVVHAACPVMVVHPDRTAPWGTVQPTVAALGS